MLQELVASACLILLWLILILSVGWYSFIVENEYYVKTLFEHSETKLFTLQGSVCEFSLFSNFLFLILFHV